MTTISNVSVHVNSLGKVDLYGIITKSNDSKLRVGDQIRAEGITSLNKYSAVNQHSSYSIIGNLEFENTTAELLAQQGILKH